VEGFGGMDYVSTRRCPRQMSYRIITAKSTDSRSWAKAGLVLDVEEA